ncbi:MAG: methylated-DNA--[protein]-cysteine S-methyltransferase [Desulfonatronovibrionaceae bacterium]
MDKTEMVSAPGFCLELKWSGPTLAKTKLFPRREWAAAPDPRTCLDPELVRALINYGPDTWPHISRIQLSLTGLSAFRTRVLLTLRSKVPFGTTITYGELARLSGHPGAARAVGRCMASNPWPVVVPCHRVLGENSLGGFGSGLKLKKTLLRLEGIHPQQPGTNINTRTRPGAKKC